VESADHADRHAAEAEARHQAEQVGDSRQVIASGRLMSGLRVPDRVMPGLRPQAAVTPRPGGRAREAALASGLSLGSLPARRLAHAGRLR
jgi:hypothetical protein